ncbi:histone H3-K56 acetyltransferase, partial [Gilbertella persicaria]|uniref:histone H3-K56 acetyltransferase n=1 Tax=Gilbertella persicaria TaxID=101096 RepID=UPI00221E9D87
MSFKTCLTHCLEHFAPVSTFQIDDIKSVYTRCTDPLIKQHDGDTHVRHRLVLVSTEQEGFLCGLETYEYKLKNRHIVYISKVDTTQTFEKFKGLTARIVQSYIASLPPLSSVFVFARAQPQYLFARSAENKQKKALNDRDLVYWWLSVLNKVPVESEGWWSVPGIDDQTSALIEIGAKRRGWRSSDKVQWHYGTSYPPEAEADQVIPRFEDDAKSRLLRNTDKMTVVDFWNLLSIGEECGSGKVTGFF